MVSNIKLKNSGSHFLLLLLNKYDSLNEEVNYKNVIVKI